MISKLPNYVVHSSDIYHMYQGFALNMHMSLKGNLIIKICSRLLQLI